ncbi:MAG: DUF998 domain-containing protein [Spirochaetales bacterium]|nr:DUF998 domain-containing protein [Spirochaetales bacterium]
MSGLTRIQKIWTRVKSIFKVLLSARISLIMVILSYLSCFMVDQVTDAIIGFGDFIDPVKFICFTLIGFIWAFQVWYWLRVFFYLEFYHEKTEKAEFFIITHLPKVLGTGALLVISLSFFTQLSQLGLSESTRSTLFTVGLIFLIYAIVFFIFLVLKKRIFKLDLGLVEAGHPESDDFLSIKTLPKITRAVLFISSGLSFFLLLIFVINPYTLPPKVGASITILFVCLTIWLPPLYWIHYGARRSGLPIFTVLFILIFVFSFFNSNKDIRMLGTQTERKYTLLEYFDSWYKLRTEEQDNSKVNKAIPMIMILSEGGGIRASYWSACLMGRLQKECPDFSKYVFAIQGVSGGSFGATVFTSLLKVYKDHPEEMDLLSAEDAKKGIYQLKAKEVIGKDYLSPVITAMFTREIIQFLLPFPIESFDHAKVFEKVWEDNWPMAVTLHEVGDKTYSGGFTSIWKNDPNHFIPPAFLNITKVENGNPFAISPIIFSEKQENGAFSSLGLTKDFYDYINNAEIRVSTASLISARFPYVGPAGLVYEKGATTGFVDGGYFDNTGANLAQAIFTYIKSNLEKMDKLQKLRDVALLNKTAVLEELLQLDEFKKLQHKILSEDVGNLIKDNSLSKLSSQREFHDLLELDELDKILDSGNSQELTEYGYSIDSTGTGTPGSLFSQRIKPVVIYIRNGSEYKDVKQSGKSLFYQLTVPTNTVFQVRDAFTANALIDLKEFIRTYKGEFIECSLQTDDEKGAPIPLGWTLSRTTQSEIDSKIESMVQADKEGVANELTAIKALLP